ncbi:MAG: serine/threonine-protein kinase [Planctomycetota bacterium]|nr:protein kinase [Planctomycetota bacterium]MCB9825991.1 protein kinase [Planctomycetota bacterium]MCB9901612.1 protein kinase [Planctomycetota bacterium]
MDDRRALTVFSELRRIEGAEARQAALRARTDGDEPLRARVAALLRAHEAPDLDLPTAAALDVRHLLAEVWSARPERPSTRTLPAGTHVGRYAIVGELGRGGAGVVYEATSEQPRRHVALKVLRAGAPQDLLQRFRLEADVLARLEHPHIATVYDAGTAQVDGARVEYLAMEFVRGRTLLDHVTHTHPKPHEIVDLLVDVAGALAFAHSHGIVHRDIKPDNVLVDASGAVRVVDFGIAQEAQREVALTRAGDVHGTLSYMSPEQVRGERVAPASDVFSFGAMAYELLAGRHPFAAADRSLAASVAAIQIAQAPSLERCAGVPRDLAAIVAKALSASRRDRYPTGRELADDLRRFVDGLPVAARPRTARYRLQRFVARNRLLSALSTAAVVSLGVAWVQAVRSSAWQQRLAQAAEVRSEHARRASLASLLTLALENERRELSPVLLRQLLEVPEEDRAWFWHLAFSRLDGSLDTVPLPNDDDGPLHLTWNGGLDLGQLSPDQIAAEDVPPHPEPGRARWVAIHRPAPAPPVWLRVWRDGIPHPPWLRRTAEGITLVDKAGAAVRHLDEVTEWPHAVSADAEHIALAWGPKQYATFDRATGELVHRVMTFYRPDIAGLGLAPPLASLLIGRRCGIVEVRRIENGQLTVVGRGQRGPVHDVALLGQLGREPGFGDASGQWVWAGLGDHAVRLYAERNGRPAQALNLSALPAGIVPLAHAGHEAGGLGVRLDSAGELEFWHVGRNVNSRRFAIGPPLRAGRLAFSPAGDQLAIVAQVAEEAKPPFRLILVDTWTGRSREAAAFDATDLACLAWAQEGRLVLTTSDARAVWHGGALAWTRMRAADTSRHLLTASPTLAVHRDDDGSVSVQVGETAPRTLLTVSSGRTTAAAISPDERYLAVGTSTGLAYLVDLLDPTPPISLEDTGYPIHAIAWHPSGRWIVAGSSYGTIVAWDVEHRQLMARMSQGVQDVNALHFAYGGERLVFPSERSLIATPGGGPAYGWRTYAERHAAARAEAAHISQRWPAKRPLPPDVVEAARADLTDAPLARGYLRFAMLRRSR